MDSANLRTLLVCDYLTIGGHLILLGILPLYSVNYSQPTTTKWVLHFLTLFFWMLLIAVNFHQFYVSKELEAFLQTPVSYKLIYTPAMYLITAHKLCMYICITSRFLSLGLNERNSKIAPSSKTSWRNGRHATSVSSAGLHSGGFSLLSRTTWFDMMTIWSWSRWCRQPHLCAPGHFSCWK